MRNHFLFTLLTIFPLSFLSWITKFPFKFNYPVLITEQNATEQYSKAIHLIRWITFVIVFDFSLTLYSTSNLQKESHRWSQAILHFLFYPLSFYHLSFICLVQCALQNLENKFHCFCCWLRARTTCHISCRFYKRWLFCTHCSD